MRAVTLLPPKVRRSPLAHRFRVSPVVLVASLLIAFAVGVAVGNNLPRDAEGPVPEHGASVDREQSSP